MDGNKLTDLTCLPCPKLKRLTISNNEIRRVDLKDSFKPL